jgi:CRP-like cAMP-binding protein
MDTNMFDTLLGLPFFQGLSKDDLTRIVGKVKLHFVSYEESNVFIESRASCEALLLLLHGEIFMETTSKDGLFTFIETLKSPCAIEPEALFGIQHCFKSTYRAKTPIDVIEIDKQFLLKVLLQYEVFRLNYENYICNRMQLLHERLWDTAMPKKDIKEKFICFLNKFSDSRKGEKQLATTIGNLATLLHESRGNVSCMLHELEDSGIIRLERKTIYIPDLAELT